MELIFLGTGAGVPSTERNVTAIALAMQQEANSIWLFDCGEATQHQILKTSIKPRKITKIFITHMHGDHIYGLPGFLSSRSFQGGDELLTVYGPAGIKEFIETSLRTSETRLAYRLEIVEIAEGQVFEDDTFLVYCKKLQHGIPCYGFRVEEKDKQGELMPEKLKAVGIQPGPIYQQIKANPTVTTDDGKVIKRLDFIGPDKPGRIVSILGDTRYPEQNKGFVKHSDCLVHEATFEQEKADLARDYFHSTTAQAAQLAKDAGVKQLILTHISSRYQKTDNARLRNEACKIFPNTEIANDFFRTTINPKHSRSD
ncbi:ribonuclease Z [Lentibacillus sp. N15]|uniref:ribonuclease Z n=1 Tax=Lentibacillus songyuanensis TaxID=3136161 RepID=UPI0031BB11F0